VSARIVVSGMVAGVPGQGGASWSVLQYVLGFRRLGHDVYLIEPVAELDAASDDYFHRLVAEFGLEGSAALVRAGTRDTAGLAYDELVRVAEGADVLVNVSGMLTDERLIEPIPVRIYLDLDPAFNQLWQAVSGIDMRFGAHTHFVTVGQSIGAPACTVPTCGLDWLPTLQPVVLERWPYANGIVHDAATTVANWRGYGSVEHDGVLYGQKAHSLRLLLDLPALTQERLLLALAIHPDEKPDLAALEAKRWRLLDPAEVAATPAAYQAFVQGSKAEVGIAKSGYVLSRCGWFSDRSACYLASGRPVVAQDTGFSEHLPTGEGLFAFTTAEEAGGALDEVAGDYERHRRAARGLAEEHFDSDRVLASLLGRL
jgi:hypothetical protein